MGETKEGIDTRQHKYFPSRIWELLLASRWEIPMGRRGAQHSVGRCGHFELPSVKHLDSIFVVHPQIRDCTTPSNGYWIQSHHQGTECSCLINLAKLSRSGLPHLRHPTKALPSKETEFGDDISLTDSPNHARINSFTYSLSRQLLQRLFPININIRYHGNWFLKDKHTGRIWISEYNFK